jgi:hypothetical protein
MKEIRGRLRRRREDIKMYLKTKKSVRLCARLIWLRTGTVGMVL